MSKCKLYFYYGTMGSCKTLKLLTTAYNLEENGIPFIVLKPSIDTRDGIGVVHSRIGIQRDCILLSENDDIFNAINTYNSSYEKLDWVLIDECQFLTEEQVNQLAEIVDELDINVMCFGLRTDFRSHLFSGSKRLFELADTIGEVKSRCSCGGKTIINARFDKDKNLVLNGEQIMIGGNETYKPLCRKCWARIIKNNTSLS